MQSEIKREFSAGGVIIDGGRALLIQMLNLEGEKVWTFPKGHLESGETPQAAALREVLEETGFPCRIIKKLLKAHYAFSRGGAAVEKDVQWYLMEIAGKPGAPLTPDEIFELKWCRQQEARKLLCYPSDLQILDMVKELL